MRFPLLLLALAGIAFGEEPADPHVTALRYWEAFDQIRMPTDDEARTLVQATDPTWVWKAENELSGLLRDNQAALKFMDRATELDRCDFALRYEDGAVLSLGHTSKMRLLARLNILRIQQARAVGDDVGAMEALLSGLSLGRHCAEDGPLVQGLNGIGILHIHAPLALELACRGALREEDLARLSKALRRLDLDWGAMMERERRSFEPEFARMKRMLDERIGRETDGKQLSGEEIRKLIDDFLGGKSIDVELTANGIASYFELSRKDFVSGMESLAAVYRLPCHESIARVAALREKFGKRHGLATDLLVSNAGLERTRANNLAWRAAAIAAVEIRRRHEAGGGGEPTLTGLDVPPDPRTGKALEIEATADGLEIPVRTEEWTLPRCLVPWKKD